MSNKKRIRKRLDSASFKKKYQDLQMQMFLKNFEITLLAVQNHKLRNPPKNKFPNGIVELSSAGKNLIVNNDIMLRSGRTFSMMEEIKNHLRRGFHIADSGGKIIIPKLPQPAP